MDKEFSRAAENACDAIASLIEENVPSCQVRNLGFQIIVLFDNKSVATVYPLTAGTVDLYGNDFNDEEYDLKNIPVQQCLETLNQLAGMNEESGTAAAGAYSPANAFMAPGQTKNRATAYAEKEGWVNIENKKRWLRETENLTQNPFGEDPLGAKGMNPKEKKTSEGRRASKIDHNYAGGSPLALSEDSGSNSISTGSLAENETVNALTQLAEKLPVDDFEIVDDKFLGLKIDCVSVFVMAQKDGNFATKAVVDGEVVQQSDNIPLGDLTKWLFTICDNVEKRAAEKEVASQELGIEPDASDVYEIMRELAEESGQSTDIIRNKSLFDLKQGLTVPKSKNENVKRPIEAEQPVSSSLKGSTVKDGKPHERVYVFGSAASKALSVHSLFVGSVKLFLTDDSRKNFVIGLEVVTEQRTIFDKMLNVRGVPAIRIFSGSPVSCWRKWNVFGVQLDCYGLLLRQVWRSHNYASFRQKKLRLASVLVSSMHKLPPWPLHCRWHSIQGF